MPDEADLGPQLSGRLGYLLKRAHVTLEALHDELLGSLGLNLRELSVLMFLASREPGSQQEAAQRLGVDRTTMVSLLDVLERRGFVARVPDNSDRRRNVIGVTQAGLDALDTGTRASDEAERRLLANLTAKQSEQLRSLLRRL